MINAIQKQNDKIIIRNNISNEQCEISIDIGYIEKDKVTLNIKLPTGYSFHVNESEPCVIKLYGI